MPLLGELGSDARATDRRFHLRPTTVAAADAVAPDVAVPECPAPEPPVGVPTKDEALAKAEQLFADWGYDVDSYEFDEPYADEWGASVNASLLLDGMKAPIMLSVGFGENGVVTYASGSLATPERGDDYPTIGAAAGLERLKEQQNQYIGLDSTSARGARQATSSSRGRRSAARRNRAGHRSRRSLRASRNPHGPMCARSTPSRSPSR